MAAITKFRANEIILRQSEENKKLYKILSGNIALYTSYGKPEEYLLGTLTAPACFGEVSFLSRQPSPYTAIALSDALLMCIPEDGLAVFAQQNQQDIIDMMKNMANNLFLLNTNIKSLIREFKGNSRPGTINTKELRRLADRALAPVSEGKSAKQEPAPAASAPPQPQPAPQPLPDQTGLSLPGHKGYPGIVRPEYKSYVYKKEYHCPHCGKNFEGLRIFHSKLVRLPTDQGKAFLNAHVDYKNFALEWYEIVTCPHCYFSTLANIFLDVDMLKKEKYEKQLAELRRTVQLDFAAERDLDFVFAQHYLALACSSGFLNFRQINAHLWLNLVWLYKSAGDDAMMEEAQSRALEANKDVYSNSRLSPEQEQRICLLIATMLYQSGEKEEARQWAYKARTNQMGKQVYTNMARQLLDDIRYELQAEK